MSHAGVGRTALQAFLFVLGAVLAAPASAAAPSPAAGAEGVRALAAARALHQPPVRGASRERQLSGARGVFFDVPAHQELSIEALGPGVLVLELVPHRAVGPSAPTVLELSQDGQRRGTLSLACQATAERFVGGDATLPCAVVARRIDLEAGLHAVSVRLRSGLGASVSPRIERAEEAPADDLELVAIAPPPPPEGMPARAGQPAAGELARASGPSSAAAASPSSARVSAETSGSGSAPAASATARGVPVPTPSLGSVAAGAPGPTDSFWQRLPRRPAIWAPAGVGVAALGLASYFALQARSSYDQARGDVTQLRGQELNEAGATQTTRANVMFGVAAVGLAAAAFVSAIELFTDARADAPGGN